MIELAASPETPGLFNLAFAFVSGGGAGLLGAWATVRKSKVDERSLMISQAEDLFGRYKMLHDDCEKRCDALHTRVELLERSAGVKKGMEQVS